MTRTRNKAFRRFRNNVRFLKIESKPSYGPGSWNEFTLTCPRRGRVGLETCLECPLSGRLLLDQHGVPVRLACDLTADRAPTNDKVVTLAIVR